MLNPFIYPITLLTLYSANDRFAQARVYVCGEFVDPNHVCTVCHVHHRQTKPEMIPRDDFQHIVCLGKNAELM